MYTLLNSIKKNDFKSFLSELKAKNNNLMSDEEELMLLLCKNKWLEMAIRTRLYKPSPLGEQIILTHRSKELGKLVNDTWGFSPDTMAWAMEDGRTDLEVEKFVYAMDVTSWMADD